MARYTGAVCRLCRREGMKLYLKGDRCYSCLLYTSVLMHICVNLVFAAFVSANWPTKEKSPVSPNLVGKSRDKEVKVNGCYRSYRRFPDQNS